MRSLLAISVLLACGGKGTGAAHIRDGMDVEVGDCTDLGKVSGTASEDDKQAEQHAKSDAREKAAKMGANTIKWIVPCCSSVEGEAYRCETPTE